MTAGLRSLSRRAGAFSFRVSRTLALHLRSPLEQSALISDTTILLPGVVAETLLWLFGVVALEPVLIVLGALLFYLSEYGMHRFAFRSPPLSWPPARRLQHRLHYDHHVEPNRLDLL